MTRFSIVFIIGLSLTVLALLAAVAFLAGQLRMRYENQLTQQTWPTRLAGQPIVSGLTQSGRAALLFGDSRMAFWTGISVSNLALINAAQPGATTAQLQFLLPGLLEKYHPSIAVFQCGINDLKLAGLKPGLEPELVAQAFANISNMVAECSQQNCRVILLETWPVGKPELMRRPVWSSAIPLAVSHLNERLRLLNAPSHGVRVVDIFKVVGVTPDDSVFRDALHLQPAIYPRLTPALKSEISLLLP